MNYKIKAERIKEKAIGLASLGKLKLPSKLSYAIGYNAEKFEREYERLEKERIKICEQYAEKDENGKAIMEEIGEGEKKISKYKFETPEKEKAFSDEYKELMEGEIEITDLRSVKFEELEKLESNQRYDVPSVKEIAALAFMLEE